MKQTWLVLFRLLVSSLILGLIVWFLLYHQQETKDVIIALRKGKWVWLSLALIAEIFYFAIRGLYFQRTFKVSGIDFPLSEIIILLLATQTISVITPSEFLATQAVFLSHKRNQDESSSRIILATLLSQLFELFSFLVILFLGVGSLFLHHDLQPYVLTAVYILLPITTLLIGGLIALIFYPTYPISLLSKIHILLNGINKLVGTSFSIPQPWLDYLSNELSEAVKVIRRNSHRLPGIFFLALLAHVIRVVCLVFVFTAFSILPDIPIALTTYSIGTLVWIVSPLPQGIGLVEGTYGLALISLGILPGPATTIALAFRGIIFWIPFILGLFTLRRIRHIKIN